MGYYLWTTYGVGEVFIFMRKVHSRLGNVGSSILRQRIIPMRILSALTIDVVHPTLNSVSHLVLIAGVVCSSSHNYTMVEMLATESSLEQ